MSNPNAPKTALERTEYVLSELTPQPETFGGSVYPIQDVQSDERQLDDFKRAPGYRWSGERSDAKLLEKTFIDMVERGDWLSEDELYGDDSGSLALITFPTAEIDDVFNHIDVIGMTSNETTGHKIMPFAIDLTYNTDDMKLARKFQWRHVYGKKRNMPSGASEFGESYKDIDFGDEEVLRTRFWPLKYRYGLKIPGFASAKYFEDRNNPWDPMHDKGRIEVMPRFVVGYATDIADVLADGMPDEEYKEKYGEEAYETGRREYRNAERCAKWCTLIECSEQADNIRYMLDNLSDEETRWMRPEELKKAKEQIAAMSTYFGNALAAANEKAKDDPDELAAKKYADRDSVCQAILKRSSYTYIRKDW